MKNPRTLYFDPKANDSTYYGPTDFGPKIECNKYIWRDGFYHFVGSCLLDIGDFQMITVDESKMKFPR